MMCNEPPLISALMGVLNCEKTLDEALHCLEAQTEERWELIICDDGSVDRTAEIIRKWHQKYPEKITILQNQENLGLNITLNRCLSLAKGTYIARMDGDDCCSPERFAKEISYLKEHPDFVVVSTDMQCFDEQGIWGLRNYPTFPQPADLVHGTPFCHAACMVQRDAIVSVGGYSESEKYSRVEDYELWVRMYAHGFRGGNIHEPLYQMRDDRSAASRRKWKYRVNEARVKFLAVKQLHLPVWMNLFALRPLILGLLPSGISAFLHRKKLQRSEQ